MRQQRLAPSSWSAVRPSVWGGLLCAALALCAVGPVAAQDADALRSQHAALRAQLASNPFGRPLVLVSTEASGMLKGDVYAVAAQPYGVVGPALQGMDHWCDILMLHLNVKGCSWRGGGAGSTLSLDVGRKFDQPIADTHRVDFSYRVAAGTADYLQVLLNAEVGPLDTKNYRIMFEAIPLDAGSSFVHLSYSYGYGMAAGIAMRGYLATLGRDKVGFSIVDHKADGTPVYVDNVRGVVERNAMRYYLAIDAYLGACHLPLAEQPEKRIREWIAATERYPSQLHEMDRDEYLVMKRKELARQQAAVAGLADAAATGPAAKPEGQSGPRPQEAR